MRIELTNDQWIEVRDKIKGGDIFAVHEASEVPIGDDGRTTSVSYQKMDDDQFAALAQRVITGWSFQVPLPPSVAAAKSVIGDLDEDDYWALYTALKPTLDKIKGGAPADPKTPPTS